MLPIDDCLRLVRLGFEKPRRQGLNLLTHIPYLLKHLKSKDSLKHHSALVRLQKLDSKKHTELIPALIEMLQNPDERFRDDKGLSDWAMEFAYPFLVKGAQDNREVVRAQAIKLLPSTTYSDQLKEVLSLCRVAIQDKSPLVRAQAIAAYGRLNQNLGQNLDQVIKVCLAGMEDKSPVVRRAATATLSRFVNRRTQLGSPFTQAQVDRVLPKLIKALDDPGRFDDSEFPPVASTVLRALATFGSKAKRAVPKLIEKLKSKDYPDVCGLFRTLPAMGPTSKAAVPELIRITQTKDPHKSDRRAMAIWALGQIGPEAKKAIPVISEALQDQEETIRKIAQEALTKINKTNK